jgi:tartrate-resistant acid phosphatase type 5
MIRIFLQQLTLLAVALWGLVPTSFAQPINEEVLSGYRGEFNKNLQVVNNAVNFIAVGDWGRNGEYYQRDVAQQMTKVAATSGTDFIVAVGDNFYPSGVQSTTDPNWLFSYENIYTGYFLHCNWYVALGNHDYKGNIQAQIDYTKISRRWQMPAPYYSKKIKLNDKDELLLVVMDTNPFITSYYSKNDELTDNIVKQDTAAQRQWLEKTLGDTSRTIKWKIVVGHHPLYSGGKRKKSPDTEEIKQKFQALFYKNKVAAYICGHEHDLQIIKQAGQYTTQFLSGAGCEVRPSGPTDGTQFCASKPGFMTFAVNEQTILVQVIGIDGQVLHTTTLHP